RMAVRWCLNDRFGADISASTRPVVDDEWLAEPLGKPLTDQASGDVDPTAGGKTGNNAHRPRWIGLRPRYTRYGRQRGCARGQMQKLPTMGKFHGVPSGGDRANNAWTCDTGAGGTRSVL